MSGPVRSHEIQTVFELPTKRDLRALALITGRYADGRPSTTAARVAVYLGVTAPTARKALRYWVRRGVVREIPACGQWAATYSLLVRGRR